MYSELKFINKIYLEKSIGSGLARLRRHVKLRFCAIQMLGHRKSNTPPIPDWRCIGAELDLNWT
jgi:hypothetical protein